MTASQLMHPPRLKLRTLIVLVALATLVVGGVTYSRRAVRYRALAVRELQEEKLARELEAGSSVSAQFYKDNFEDYRQAQESVLREAMRSPDKEWVEKFTRKVKSDIREKRQDTDAKVSDALSTAQSLARDAAQHARRRAAYLRCAGHPWLSPPADEPERE